MAEFNVSLFFLLLNSALNFLIAGKLLLRNRTQYKAQQSWNWTRFLLITGLTIYTTDLLVSALFNNRFLVQVLDGYVVVAALVFTCYIYRIDLLIYSIPFAYTLYVLYTVITGVVLDSSPFFFLVPIFLVSVLHIGIKYKDSVPLVIAIVYILAFANIYLPSTITLYTNILNAIIIVLFLFNKINFFKEGK